MNADLNPDNESPVDTQRLDQADACHDEDPAGAAELLRAITVSRVPAERLATLAYLLNHVLGEKLSAWDEALQRQRAVIAAAQPSPAPVLWRQAATAAHVAQASDAAHEWTQAYAQAVGAPAERCVDVLQLGAAVYVAPGLGVNEAAEHVHAALARLDHPAWQFAGPLDAAVAAGANNIASGLLERAAEELQHPALRTALARAAELAQRFWLRAGTWVQHERALYLRAMVCNTLGEPTDARDHALAALALLDTNDSDQTERIDRAFIELEREQACRQLGLAHEAQAAGRSALALAGGFDDAAIGRQFAERAAVLRAMPGPAAAVTGS